MSQHQRSGEHIDVHVVVQQRLDLITPKMRFRLGDLPKRFIGHAMPSLPPH